MLTTVKIEGKILDWEVPLEIEIGQKPLILVGRNGSGKSLVGYVIELCSRYLNSIYSPKSEDRNAILHRMGELFEKVGIQKVSFTFSNLFFNQWNNEIYSNLPIAIMLNEEYFGEWYDFSVTDEEDDVTTWDFDINVEHSVVVEFYFEEPEHNFVPQSIDAQMLPKTNITHSMKIKGYVDSMFELTKEQSNEFVDENGTINLDEEIVVSNIQAVGLTTDLVSKMCHEVVIKLSESCERKGLRLICFDPNIMIGEDNQQKTVKRFCGYLEKNILDLMLENFNHRWEVSEDNSELPDFVYKESSYLSNSYGFRKDLEWIDTILINDMREEIPEDFQPQDTFEDNEYCEGYYDLLSSFGEKFFIPDIDSFVEKYGKFSREQKEEFEKLISARDRIRFGESGHSYMSDYMIARHMTEPEFLETQSDFVKSIIYEVVLNWWWMSLDNQPMMKTQILLIHEFGISHRSLQKPLPSGVRNLSFLIHKACTSSRNQILFIDEPEISLHVDWQSKVIEVIQKCKDSVQVIFTSHSPEVVVNNLDLVATIPPQVR